ncbi:hypothetical protein D770_20290 [Flammeovirgaceae bacterium 311]|nr:hypothetical protein D770_20290 [Flammeovirgaceae bacterium 311]
MSTEIEKLDRLDQIRAHLLDKEPLSEKQSEMLSRYRACFTWMSENQSPARAIALAEAEYGISYAQAAKIVRDSIQLYGDIHDYSKEGLKNLMFERFLAFADRAEEAGDFRAAERALDKAAKIKDLYNPKVAAFDISAHLTFNIAYTDDPEALKRQQTIDVSYDEE